MSNNPENRIPKRWEGRTLVECFDGKFVVGQCYDKKPAQQLRCTVCHGTKFEVATGHCFTAIRCPKCRYEMMIHTG